MSEQHKRNRNITKITGIESFEPTVSKENYKMDLITALNWYNVAKDDKQIRTYADKYISAFSPSCKCIVDSATDIEIRRIGLLGRLIMRKQYVSPEHILALTNTVAMLCEKYKEKQEQPSIKILIEVKEGDASIKHAQDIDTVIDDFIRNKSSDFDISRYINSSNISKISAKKLVDIFTKTLDEVSSDDPEIKEGYSNFSKIQFRKFQQFISSIVNGLTEFANTKLVRKPRKKKAKPASTVVAKIKHMSAFAELGLKSIDPVMLVKAKEVWLYNTQYRKLTYLVLPDTSSSFDIRGTSLYGFDESNSLCKRLRKPAEFFKEIGNWSSKKSIMAFKKITASECDVSGRLNEHTIILSAY